MSVFAVVAEDSAIGVENLALADKADVFAFFDDGKIPSCSVVENLHNLIHAFIYLDFCRGNSHEFIDKHFAVKVRSEHDVTNIIEQHHA